MHPARRPGVRHVRVGIFIPSSAKPMLRRLRSSLQSLAYAGSSRHCPVCGRSAGRFASAGRPRRKGVRCIGCGSLERHRLLWLFFTRHPELLREGMRLLHVAPEPSLSPRLRSRVGAGYLSADLMNPTAMESMDICDIRHPDASFDAVYCSHVLEHVADDRKAMREFHRILRPDGWAILLVPITAERTYEDPSIVDPAERLAAFGQEDHVRRYGPDYVDRLREAGFDVQVHDPLDIVAPEDVARYGLVGGVGSIYLCTRRP